MFRFSIVVTLQIAAQTAAPFNPNVQLTPIHGNIKEPQYDIPWFQTYDIVLNALDNLGKLQGIYLSHYRPPTMFTTQKTPADT